MFHSIISDKNERDLLLELLKKDEYSKLNIIFLNKESYKDTSPFKVAFINEISLVVRSSVENIVLMSNSKITLAILEFDSYLGFNTFCNELNLNLDKCDKLNEIIEVKESIENNPQNTIYITCNPNPRLEKLKVSNAKFIKNIKSLLMLDDEIERNRVLNSIGKNELYYANVLYYLKSSLTDKNYSSDLISYNNNKDYQLIINDKILKLISDKKLPKVFKIVQ